MASNVFFYTIYSKAFFVAMDLRDEVYKILRQELLEDDRSNYVNHQNKKKAQAVRFNPGLENEYIVTFSERGFVIGDTRLSFEELENALSKEYTITLKDGTVLDPVKMQQIMKYEDVY